MKCNGCGVTIQTTNPTELGYIRSDVLEKNMNNFLCERCFKLKHYNISTKIMINEEEFIENTKKINKTFALICNIVDVFDLEGTLINNINSLFPNNPILIIGNKYDLFLRSNRPTKIKKYINSYLDEKGIKVCGVICTSSKEERGLDKLYLSLLKTCQALNIKDNLIYLFGVSNVGKSSLLKALLNKLKTESNENLVISNTIGTTLGFNEFSLGELKIVDTPGIINKKQITYYLDKDTLNVSIPTKFVKPKVFQLNPGQTLFIEGFAWFSYYGENKCSFVAYFSNRLKLHRTKANKANDFYLEHKDDIFSYPNKTERERLGKLQTISYQDISDCEISLSGLGFLSFFGFGRIEVTTFNNIMVGIRKQLI